MRDVLIHFRNILTNQRHSLKISSGDIISAPVLYVSWLFRINRSFLFYMHTHTVTHSGTPYWEPTSGSDNMILCAAEAWILMAGLCDSHVSLSYRSVSVSVSVSKYLYLYLDLNLKWACPELTFFKIKYEPYNHGHGNAGKHHGEGGEALEIQMPTCQYDVNSGLKLTTSLILITVTITKHGLRLL